jgi:putative FmdB family regulatory protein
MPVYTYQCDGCGVRFDRYQKFTEQTLTRCPECGKKTLRKVFQPVGIVFKGSGFYSTDHRSPSGGIGLPGKTAEKNSEGGKSSEGEKNSDSGKSAENKPVAKPAETVKPATSE